MTEKRFFELVRNLVADYTNAHLDATDCVRLDPEDVYIVWACKALQNFKCLASTPLPDGMYYEITYNGDKQEAYFDAYKRYENRAIPIE